MKNLILGSLLFLAGTPASAQETVKLEVTEKGFVPSEVNVKPGTDVVLEVTRKTDQTCSTEIQVPSKKINEKLPLNKTVTIALGKLEKGEIRFGCGMNMMDGGKIFVR
jgi:plastocyanin domain-containing protein